jgi:hypothetical protein
MTTESVHRSNPPINAKDFGVPAEFAECAENYARWAIAAERTRACRIVTGLCISDNNAREINEAIRTQAADRLARHGIQIPEDEEYGNPSF